MSSQSPAPWTFAARAAYFGDRVCAFCHHHNPAGARFCNECASPLQLKPCDRCDAVNDYTASSCHNCGVTFPLSFGSSEAASASRAELPAGQGAIAGEVGVAATAMQRPSATSALRAYWRSVRPAQFLFTAIATILIAGAYGLHHLKGPVTPDAIEAP